MTPRKERRSVARFGKLKVRTENRLPAGMGAKSFLLRRTLEMSLAGESRHHCLWQPWFSITKSQAKVKSYPLVSACPCIYVGVGV